ncbi:MAG: bifunctional nuclease family protein [Bacteroidota bacterium]
MEKIRLEFSALMASQYQHGAYTLELIEADGKRMLKIAIGTFEAQSIAIELEHMTPNRPLTHDLFKSFAREFNIELLEVVIYKLKEGVFYSNLVFSDGKNTHEIDSRTSDAIALAVRFNAPIYTFDRILDQAGIVKEAKEEGKSAEDTSPQQKSEKPGARRKLPAGREEGSVSASEFASFSEEELNDSLNQALEEEEYELASKIRDEINKRKGGTGS